MFSFFFLGGGGEIKKGANHRRNLSVETSGVDLISSEEQVFDKPRVSSGHFTLFRPNTCENSGWGGGKAVVWSIWRIIFFFF